MNTNIKLREFKNRIKHNIYLLKFYRIIIQELQCSFTYIEENIEFLYTNKLISNTDINFFCDNNANINSKLKILNELNLLKMYKIGYRNLLKEIIYLQNFHKNIILKFGTKNLILTFKCLTNKNVNDFLPKYITENMSCFSIKHFNNEDIKQYKTILTKKNDYKLQSINNIEYVDPFIINNGLKLILKINKRYYSIIMFSKLIYSHLSIYVKPFENKIEEVIVNLSNRINNKKFIQNYVNYLPYNNLILKSEEQLSNYAISLFTLYKKTRVKNITTLTKEINNECQKKQFEIIYSLLLDDHHLENTYIANILLNEINNNNDVNYLNIISCLHVSLRNKIKRIPKINYKESLDDNDISKYENKILICKCSEQAKLKAYEKNKELQNLKNSENSSKVIQYLDGFLKIPFDIYHNLQIHDAYKLFLYNYKNMVQQVVGLKNNLNLEKFDNILITDIINRLENNSQISQRSINNFFNFFNIINNQSYYNINKKHMLTDKISKIFNEKDIITISKKYKLRTKLINTTIKKLIEETSFINDYEEYICDNGFGNKTVFNSLKKQINTSKEYWNIYKTKQKDYLSHVDNVLDNTVYGMNEAKSQIKRVIGQWISGEQTSTVFGFGGPPGTGKTTLAKGISKCIINEKNERPIIFIAVGGSSNGSTLEGHNYTYVGSTWGRIVEGLMTSKCMNPIIYIDELDKISKTEHGREIIGILIHLTDPSQNNQFQDKYFAGIDLDLSKCLIIFSYNNINEIDKILLDRIHNINTKTLSKYDKINIANKFLLPEIYNNLNLSTEDIYFDDESITYIIDNFTFEAGVRKLKEKIYELIRELNVRIINEEFLEKININTKLIDNILGENNKLNLRKINESPQIGRVCGMYASSYGSGGITIIESSKSLCEQKLSLELTGNQGNVMKESMKVSKTLAWSLISDDIKKKIRNDDPFGIHIHCPEAAVSKDGPSAGVAITVCIISLLADIPIKNNISITGEVDLNGNVLAIGGLESKLEGAKNAGIKLALYPKENEKDMNKIIEENKLLIDNDFNVQPVSKIIDVINIIFDNSCIKPSFLVDK